MPLTVTMPQLGESVTEGTIARWLKQPGDAIAKYESIAEVITDKVNAEIPAPADGVMSEVIAPEGTVVPVGQPICSIETAVAASSEAAATVPAAGSDGASAGARAEPVSGASAPAQSETSAPATPPAMSPPQTSQPELAGDIPSPARSVQPAPATPEPREAELAASAQGQGADGHQPAGASLAESSDGNGSAAGYHLTPAVRMLVREHGVDLRALTGSGLGGASRRRTSLSTSSGETLVRYLSASRPGCPFRRLRRRCRLHGHPSRLRPCRLQRLLWRPPSRPERGTRWCRFRRSGGRSRSTWCAAGRRRRTHT